MKIEFDTPRDYDPSIPIFGEGGRPTERTLAGFENVMAFYTQLAKLSRTYFDNNPANYFVSDVYVVGSGARENRVDSDLDLLLIAPKLDETSANQAKVFLAMAFFCDRSKQEAVDVFIRSREIYPERSSVNITSDVREILDNYNGLLNSSD